MIRADSREVELGQAFGRGLGRDTAQRLAVGVEGHQGDDRQRRDAAHSRDCRDELVQVEERLQHQQVDASSLEDLSLLAEVHALVGGVEPLDLADRADRAGDVDVGARDLPCLAGQAHRRRVDPLELVLEEVVGELAPVGAERVRLDQLGAGADEARVQRDDALRRAQVRLLGTAQPRTAPEISAPMPPSATIGGPAVEALLEPARHRATVVKWSGSSTPIEGRVNSGRVIPGAGAPAHTPDIF